MPKHFLAVCLCIVTVYGCQSTNQSQNSGQQQGQAGEQEDIQGGQSAFLINPSEQTSTVLKQRFSNAQDRSDRDSLRRSKAFLDSGDFESALERLAMLAATPDNPQLADVYFRLRAAAEIGLYRPLAASASLAKITYLSPEGTTILENICIQLADLDCLTHIHVIDQIRRTTLNQTKQDAFWAKMQQAPNLPSVHRPADWNDALNPDALLNRVPRIRAQDAQITATANNWLQLYRGIASAGSIPQAQRFWKDWASQNDNHPAAILPPTPLRQLLSYNQPKIVVMLPLSGRLAAAGHAVRDGFIAGYFADQTLIDTPAQVSFLDSNEHDDADLVVLSHQNQSDVVIGPLAKKRAQGVLDATNAMHASQPPQLGRSSTLMLLNRVNQTNSPANANTNIYQFAAAIEDEALTLAQQLTAQGHSRILLLTNQEPWALRAKLTLLKNWQGPTAQATFQQTRDITGAVGEAMGVGDSDKRHKEIEKLIGQELEFLPRERKDLDAVVALTSGLEAKSLVPALKFHFADELPVFATSQTARTQNLDELSGFFLTAIPLLASPDDLGKSATTAFELNDEPLIELYALGLDAYRLATWTHWLNENQDQLAVDMRFTLSLASGNLTFGAEGLIDRSLMLARIDRKGNLQPSQARRR